MPDDTTSTGHHSHSSTDTARPAGSVEQAPTQLCSDIASTLAPLLDMLAKQRDEGMLNEAIERELLSVEQLYETLTMFGGRLEHKPQHLDLGRWLASQRFELTKRAKHALLTLHIEHGTPPLEVDVEGLSFALGELIENALTAGASQIELRCKSIDGHAGRHVCLTVRDDAGGIPARLAARCHLPATSGCGRAGHGLARVFGIARCHRGRLIVDGDAGEGSEISIMLPAYRRRRRPSAVADLPHGHERILVVDDEPLAREAVRRVLSSLGYDVEAASGGIEALAMHEELPHFDVLLCDVNMPDMRGFEVATKIEAATPKTKVIFMCGYPPETIEDAPEGARFLEKPFSHQELAMKLREILAAKGQS
jgi:CheY-like chemotaxis protein